MKTLTTLLLIIILSLLGMSFYLNDKIERLEVKLAFIDTLNVNVIKAESITLTNGGSDTVYLDTYKAVYKSIYVTTDYKKTYEVKNVKTWKEITKP